VPALVTEPAVEGRPLSMRDAMAAHRNNPACMSCHSQLDPIGFALEQFDAVGRWRGDDGSVNATSELPDGTRIDGVAGLKAMILANPERFVSSLAERLLMYALGRNIQYYDLPAVRGIVRHAAGRDYTFKALVEGVVTSVPFRQRLVPEARQIRSAQAGEPAAAVTAEVR
jgi:hypothetical protein